MRAPVTKVFRRAGCGKSACPVRRGDGEPADSSAALRPTLPAHMLFLQRIARTLLALRHVAEVARSRRDPQVRKQVPDLAAWFWNVLALP
jgi:hypothetical protein